MAEEYRIGEGYVEINSRVDNDAIARDAERAGGDFESRFSRTLQDGMRRREGELGDSITRTIRPAGEPAGNGLGRGLFGSMGDFIRGQGTKLFSSDMMSTVGTGMKGALSSTAVMAPLAVFAAYAASALGAAITAGLGVATAGGFIALAAVALRNNKQLVASFKDLGDTANKMLTKAAQPLVGPFMGAIRELKSRLPEVGTLLGGIFGTLGPSIKSLAGGLGDLVVNLLGGIRNAMPGINMVFQAFSSRLGDIGTALGGVFERIFHDGPLAARTTDLIVTALIKVIEFIGGAVHVLTVFFGGMTNLFLLVKTQIANAGGSLKAFVDGGTGMFARIGQAFLPLKTALGELWAAWEKFAAASTDAQRAAAWDTLVEKIRVAWSKLKTFLGVVLQEAWDAVVRVWNTTIKPWIQDVAWPWLVQKMKDMAKAAFNAFVDWAVGYLRSLPGKAMSALAGLGSSMMSPITTAFTTARTKVSTWIGNLGTEIGKLPGKARTAVSGLWGSMSGAFSTAVSTARTRAAALVTGAIGQIGQLPGKIRSKLGSVKSSVTGAFSGAGSWLIQAGRNIISGLISGISGMIGSLQSKLGSVTNMIPDWKGPAEKDKKLLTPNGELIMGGLMKGIDAQLPGLRAQLGGITAGIPTMVGSTGSASTTNHNSQAVHIGQVVIRSILDPTSPANNRKIVAELYDQITRFQKTRTA